MDPVIRVEHLSKSYVLRHKEQVAYTTMRDTLMRQAKTMFGRSGERAPGKETFWALDDVSFELRQGDRLGIIGRNGAGKSTLLKLLSRIVTPTKGRITIEGRVASLLEVGTGFHPELSGRENIFLNGAILGMDKQEIKSKFDEIVAFAEVEKFLDTPVKRYSSGMYVRLAFSVAAHLDPEILIVDEVLAVGDAVFQKKCLTRMQEVAGQGRTILFVSHNMAAIQNLCDSCIYLKNGRLISQGRTDEVVASYLKSGTESQVIQLADRTDRTGNGRIKFESVRLKDEQRNDTGVLQSGKTARIRIAFTKPGTETLNNLQVAFALDDENGQRVAHINNELTNEIFESVEPGAHQIEIEIPRFPFCQGLYSFTLYASVKGEIADWVQEAGVIEVESGDFFGSGRIIQQGQSQFLFDYHFNLI
ncbi:MAG: ABC transporter ATP-binding protein [Bacteroidia bacterium]